MNNFFCTLLLQKLPLMLVKLLDQREGESLERLQLVGVEIKLLEQTKKQEIFLKRLTLGTEQFLELHGFLHGPMVMDVRIRYFVRGQRKFYRPSIPQIDLPLVPWKTMDQAWIINRLSECGQENSALTSQKLALLNGRKNVQIPSHLVLVAALDEAVKNWPTERSPLSCFEMTFYNAVILDNKLFKGVFIGENSLDLILNQNGTHVLFLKASSEEKDSTASKQV